MFGKCRGCLCSSGSMRDLSQPGSHHLIEKFTTLTDVEWLKNDNLGAFLCHNCEDNLEHSFRFRELCRQSHDVFVNWLAEPGKNENVVEVQEELVVKEEDKVVGVAIFSDEIVSEAIRNYQSGLRECKACLVCEQNLIGCRGLALHMNGQHKEFVENWCAICNAFFDDIEAHKNGHPKKSEQCTLCFGFYSRKHMINHLRLHSSSRPFTCDICKSKFISGSALRSHYKTHKDKEELNAVNVEMLLEELETGELKEEELEELEELEGEIDGDEGVENEILKIVIVDEKPAENMNYTCELCRKPFKTKRALQIHILIHKGETLHKCEICQKCFRSRTHLDNHMRTHTGEKPYMCSYCGKGFSQISVLYNHKKLHTGRKEICPICQKGFCRHADLRLHLRKHKGEKPFLCPTCGEAFAQHSHLREHSTRHSDVRPFQCTLCDKAFKKKTLLNNHLKIHSGVKTFQCTECDYACYNAYRLEQHMKMQHSPNGAKKKKQHDCPVCKRSFRLLRYLKSHMVTEHDVIVD